MRPPDRVLDEAVKAAHSRDRWRANLLIDYFVEMPPKAEALRFVVRVLESCREDGAGCPVLAEEMAIRRAAAAQEVDA